ncbi:hypothetical protein D3C80_1645240 [compost metagenome]
MGTDGNADAPRRRLAGIAAHGGDGCRDFHLLAGQGWVGRRRYRQDDRPACYGAYDERIAGKAERMSARPGAGETGEIRKLPGHDIQFVDAVSRSTCQLVGPFKTAAHAGTGYDCTLDGRGCGIDAGDGVGAGINDVIETDVIAKAIERRRDGRNRD